MCLVCIRKYAISVPVFFLFMMGCRFDTNVITPRSARPLCGNGIVDIGEMCDDGNTSSGDGCSVACQTEDGYTCGPLHFDSNVNDIPLPITYRGFTGVIQVSKLQCLLNASFNVIKPRLGTDGLPELDNRVGLGCQHENPEHLKFLFGDGPGVVDIHRAIYFNVNTLQNDQIPVNFFEKYLNPEEGFKPYQVSLNEQNSAEVRLSFVYSKGMPKLTFISTGYLMIFVGGNKVFSGMGLKPGVPAKESDLIDLNLPSLNLEEGKTYQMDVFHINFKGKSIFRMTIPQGLVGPTYCYKCGDRIVEGHEICDGNFDPKDGHVIDEGCLETCLPKNGFRCTYTLNNRSYCSL